MDATEEVEIWWKRWREDHDPIARERLIVIYSPWARTVARDVYTRIYLLGDAWQDCTQNALIGLLEAIERFDPDRGASFQTFARYRIRGAVFNGLRHLRESLARGSVEGNRSQEIHERFESLDESSDVDPLESFVSSTVGLALGFLLESTSLPDSESSADAYSECVRDELKMAVLESLKSLDTRDQTIITLHYYHHVAFGDIASQLNVTKGRVSQLHKRALERLRGGLAAKRFFEY